MSYFFCKAKNHFQILQILQIFKLNKKHLCQSCHCLIEDNENFCSICGQKKITKTASFRELAGEFFSNILTFDSKVFRTLFPLFFIPGKLTKEYLEGKRNLYYTPIRLFLFSMTFAFIFLNYWVVKVFSSNEDLETNVELRLQIKEDSLQKVLYQVFPDSISQQKIALVFQDSVIEINKNEENKIFFSLGSDGTNITENDMFLLSGEELIKKYKIESFWEQIFIQQLAKFTKTPQGFQFYIVSHLSWLVLSSIPFIGLLLKLLYIRQKRTYVEHSVFVLHWHTFIFAVSFFLFAWLLWQDKNYDTSSAFALLLLVVTIYFVFSLKKVYGQGTSKTLIKTILFSIGYLFIIIITFAVFTGMSFLIY